MYYDRTVKELQADNRLWPEAMLPAWFVADENLRIVHCNPFGYDLIERFSLSHLLEGRLSIAMSDLPEGQESLWRSILSKENPDNFRYMEFAVSVLEQHRVILKAAMKIKRPFEPETLVAQLRSVTGMPGVKPYVHRPRLGSSVLQIGIRISPPQGLKLLDAVPLEDGDVSFIDIVMAYRVLIEWEGGMVREVVFQGAQPAIHDASERPRQREQKDAEISGLLSHAFKQPLATIERDLNDMQNTEFTMDRRNRIARDVGIEVERVIRLVQLLNFVNSSDEIHFQLKLGGTGVTFSVASVVEGFAKILRNTDLTPERAIDTRKMRRLFEQAEIRLEDREPGTEDYKALAEKLTCFQGIRSDAVFGIELKEGQNESSAQIQEHGPEKVKQRIRTALVDLMLNEMLVNAIKCASDSSPDVLLSFEFVSPRLNIEVFNNGKAMTVEQFTSPIESLAPGSGEKRKALGLMLNKRAAGVLGGAALKLGDPGVKGGTRLMLEIRAY